jgi:hypothetical protein
MTVFFWLWLIRVGMSLAIYAQHRVVLSGERYGIDYSDDLDRAFDLNAPDEPTPTEQEEGLS